MASDTNESSSERDEQRAYAGQALGLMRGYIAGHASEQVGLLRRGARDARAAVRARAEQEAARAQSAVLERVREAAGIDARELAEPDADEPSDSQLISALRGFVRDQARARGGALVHGIRARLDQPERATPRKLFDQLLALGQRASGVDVCAETGRYWDEPTRELWRERSSVYLDCMEPEGRRWLELALRHSLLPRDADLSWALDPAARLGDEQEHQIGLDLPRTFPDVEYFTDETVTESLRRVLRGAALVLPDVGYVQGMNFMGAFLLLHTKAESEALRLLVELLANPLYNLRCVFTEGLPSLHKLAAVLQSLIRDSDPALWTHLEALGFGDLFFSYQWICTLFAYTMPLDALTLVWNLFFRDGWEGFFAVAMALVADNRRELREADFESAFAIMKESAANPRQDFSTRANAWDFSEAQRARIRAAVR